MDYSFSITKVILLIIILSILGINVFNYLDITTKAAGKITKDTIGAGIDGTSNTLTLAGKGVKEFEKALDIKFVTKDENNEDVSDSDIQMPKKSGYCYIGEDRGHRSCVRVGKGDVCMSGDIFPSIEICINPSLRA